MYKNIKFVLIVLILRFFVVYRDVQLLQQDFHELLA